MARAEANAHNGPMNDELTNSEAPDAKRSKVLSNQYVRVQEIQTTNCSPVRCHVQTSGMNCNCVENLVVVQPTHDKPLSTQLQAYGDAYS